MDMHKPNYQNGSIVNLMSSVKKALGGKSKYKPLEGSNFSNISEKNIVLIIIDGFGYNYLTKYGRNSFLYKNLKGKMTSVFPTTTASALTTFSTGLAPQQHALTGWFMYLKEIGTVSVILPFTSRAGGLKLSKGKIKYKDIYNEKSFFEDLKTVSTFIIKHKAYINSEFSCLVDKGAKKLPFSNLSGFFRQINKALNTASNKKYILAYWDSLDSLCHKKGVDSQETKKHFNELDKKIKSLAKSLKSKNTVIIISADHGLIDTKEKGRIIELKNHSRFVETLAMPLSGEPRAVYCYVKPRKVKQFENYVKTEFKNVCDMYKSDDLIKNNYFGLFEPNEKLKERIGDYVLIMRKNYIMKDLVLGEEQNIFIGNHGGMSEDEMFVPLVVVE